MPRLFIGLPVADETVDALITLQSGLEGARWVSPGDFHLTLRFIGNVDGDVAMDVDEALAAIGAPPVRVSVTGFDAFGKDRPRSVHASVVPDAALMALQARIERAMQDTGLEPEHRRFTPHITVARLTRVHPENVTAWLADKGGRAIPDYTAHSVALYSANSSRGGGPYRVESTIPLAE